MSQARGGASNIREGVLLRRLPGVRARTARPRLPNPTDAPGGRNALRPQWPHHLRDSGVLSLDGGADWTFETKPSSAAQTFVDWYPSALASIISEIRELRHGPETAVHFVGRRHGGHLVLGLEHFDQRNGMGLAEALIPRLANHRFRRIDIVHSLARNGRPRDVLSFYGARARAQLRSPKLLPADLAKRLYAHRNGIAHGKSNVAQGGNRDGYFEIARDLPIVKLLARLAISDATL